MLKQYSRYVSTLYSFDVPANRRLQFILKRPLRPFKRDAIAFRHGYGLLGVQQRRNFDSFTKHYVNDSFASVFPDYGLSHLRKSNDFYVIGSDQVWNDQWISSEMLKLRLGQFFPEGSFISYAGSFGVNDVKVESRKIFLDYLSRFSAISVREDRGAELVRDLSGRSAQVVLDPTLMMPADKWCLLDHGFVSDEDDYVLTYFLGRPSETQEAVIQQYAKEHHCRIRRMLDLSDPETYIAGPREFVELFSKAKYIFTDSYHACCFSILFGKQFKVFYRDGNTGKSSMNSRMLTLFRLFNLDNDMSNETEFTHIDYDEVNRLLAQHRQESWQWLDSAMAGIGVRR